MNVSCPECQSVFRVDPAKIPGPGVRARCSVCGGVIALGGPARSWADDFAGVPGAGARRASGEHGATATQERPPAVSAPQPGVRGATPSAGETRQRTPTFGGSSASPAPNARATPTPEPRRSLTPPRVPPFVPGRRATPPAGLDPIARQTPAPTPPAPRQTPSDPAPSALPAAGAPGATPPRLFTTPAAVPATPAQPPRAVTPTAGAGRAPLNPFLANDPNQKAKRLARALVSDMVAYHPQKREEGLRDGTLKQLFREEIKKSYEEYVEQIGKDFADTTSHFQDALNDVLAGGRKIF